jgi:DNA-binding XRE family transcriptional regulator
MIRDILSHPIQPWKSNLSIKAHEGINYMSNKALDRFYIAVGNEIRMTRSKYGLSQTELFDRTGIHRETISRIESGSQQLSLHQLFLLCRAFDLTPDQLLEKVLDYEIES